MTDWLNTLLASTPPEPKISRPVDGRIAPQTPPQAATSQPLQTTRPLLMRTLETASTDAPDEATTHLPEFLRR